MPTIKSSAELRNDYNGISNLCHEYNETVFITKNGKGDLAVMSIQSYENLVARFELYTSIERGLQDVRENNVRPLDEVMAALRGRKSK